MFNKAEVSKNTPRDVSRKNKRKESPAKCKIIFSQTSTRLEEQKKLFFKIEAARRATSTKGEIVIFQLGREKKFYFHRKSTISRNWRFSEKLVFPVKNIARNANVPEFLGNSRNFCKNGNLESTTRQDWIFVWREDHSISFSLPWSTLRGSACVCRRLVFVCVWVSVCICITLCNSKLAKLVYVCM